jgi:hypothetical protein
MSNDTLYNAVASDAKGIVIAGAGGTSFNYAVEDVRIFPEHGSFGGALRALCAPETSSHHESGKLTP